MTLRIDAHQHYWDPQRGDYAWMRMDDPVLARLFGPDDLAPELAAAGIDRTVLVQAAGTVAETEYMLGLAEATESVAAVVGWIDFDDRDHVRHLERLKTHPKFVGVRPMIEYVPDVDWMLSDDVQWAYAALVDLDLTFDAVGFSRHLENFLALVKRYPKLRLVVDHCMKPQIRDHGSGKQELASWGEGLRRIAAESDACCKLSGLVTETDGAWREEDLAPYAEVVLRAFGPERVMWGSDWPVCTQRASYQQWHRAAQALCAGLTEAGRAEVFGGTASRFYGLAER